MKLVCKHCSGTLKGEDGGYRCTGCNETFPTINEATGAVRANQGESDYSIGDASRRAADIVSQERDSHGDAYENHKQIGELWTALLSSRLKEGEHIPAWLAAIMMQNVKQSRMVSGYLKFDHFCDINGYSDVALYSAIKDPDVDVEMGR